MSADAPHEPTVEPKTLAGAVEPPHRPSPYESIPTPSHPGPRGGEGRSGPRGLLGWLFGDLPLKILALVLAIMVWRLVHDTIERGGSVDDVLVEVVGVPNNVRLVGGNLRTVTLTLKGAGSEVERVANEFQRPGTRTTLRLNTFTGDHGELQPVSDPKRLGYSVAGAADVATNITPPIRVEWYLVESRDVTVEAPDILPFRGRSDLQTSQGYPTVDPEIVRVTGPKSVVSALTRDSRIRPDPIDATRWIESDPDLTVPFDWKSSFDQWRGYDETRSRDLLTIEPPQVRGKLRLQVTSSDVLENALQVLYPPGTDADSYKGLAWEISGTGAEYDRTTGKIRLGIRGPQRAVSDMKAKPVEWSYTIELPPPPAEGEAPKANQPAPVYLWWKQDTPAGVRLDGRPTVFVSLKRR